MLCSVNSGSVLGIDAVPVAIEVNATQGLPCFHLVGLANGAVREGTVRIKSAITNSGYVLPHKSVTVNLAPAALPKDGAAFDLPIAIGTLVAHEVISPSQQGIFLAGELALDGTLRPIRGALSLAERARRDKRQCIVVPKQNAIEAALVSGITVYGVETLLQAVKLVEGTSDLLPYQSSELIRHANSSELDFGDIQGLPEGRRAAEVAAAGGHNLLLIGPPGSGKTMIARRMPSILPFASREEALETTKVHSVAGLVDGTQLTEQRPFRAPHHTCSVMGLVGGGSFPQPGEVSLAHHGVLFLDELPEFPRSVLEALRQPLEDGTVTIVRAQQTIRFPARFMLVAAMNPCPCGYRGSTVRTCTCGERRAQLYRSRISGPLLDRFDLFVNVDAIDQRDLLQHGGGESSAEIAARVQRARQLQQARFSGEKIHCNAQMTPRHLRKYVNLNSSLQQLIVDFCTTYALSARAVHRFCRVARTIADLEGAAEIIDEHVFLALSLLRARWSF